MIISKQCNVIIKIIRFDQDSIEISYINIENKRYNYVYNTNVYFHKQGIRIFWNHVFLYDTYFTK